jgi:hypothetical protein
MNSKPPFTVCRTLKKMISRIMIIIIKTLIVKMRNLLLKNTKFWINFSNKRLPHSQKYLKLQGH